MHSCWLYLTVISKDCEAELSRYIEIPIQPAVGIRLIFDEEKFDVFNIEEIEYLVKDDVFWLSGEYDGWSAECPCTPDSGCCVFDPDDWTGLGWTIESIRRGDQRLRDFEGMFDPEHTLSKRLEASINNDRSNGEAR